MIWLLIGIILWSVLHFIPSLAQGFRASLIAKWGDKPYRIVFSVGIVLSVVLMVLGWRAADQWSVYAPPVWGHPVGSALILIAFLFFGLAHEKTNLKRYVHHPQLTGLIIWAVGHLLANGDNLSLLLFGGLGLWALIEIPLINRREGAWQKPEPMPISSEIRPVLIGLAIFAVFLFAHPYLFGVSPMPR
ncbi:MAG: NnrU family protein [Geminicoccales bacterium]